MAIMDRMDIPTIRTILPIPTHTIRLPHAIPTVRMIVVSLGTAQLLLRPTPLRRGKIRRCIPKGQLHRRHHPK